MLLEAGFHRARLVAVLTVAAQGYQAKAVAVVTCAKPHRELVAIDAGQADIEHRHCRTEFCRAIQCGFSVVRHVNDETESLEGQTDRVRGIVVVIDDEDSQTAIGLSHPRRPCGRRSQRRLGQIHVRQLQDELTAAARSVAFRTNRPAVQLGQVAHDGQPQPEAPS